MKDQRKAVFGFAALRIAYAAAGAAAPGPVIGPWLGAAAERGGGRVAARALLARDGLISAGLGEAAAGGRPQRPWLAALIASDLCDIAATLADRDGLPPRAAPATVAVAGTMALAGAALYRAAGD